MFASLGTQQFAEISGYDIYTFTPGPDKSLFLICTNNCDLDKYRKKNQLQQLLAMQYYFVVLPIPWSDFQCLPETVSSKLTVPPLLGLMAIPCLPR